MEYYYLALNIFSFLCPLVLSFDKKVHYVEKWKFAFISIVASFVIFLPWDLYFHQQNVWWFNDKYTLGLDFFGLPLEENLFFITIPFACIFVLECVRFYFSKFTQKVENKLHWAHLLIFNALTLLLLSMYWDKLYSFTVFSLTLIIINLCAWKCKRYFALCLVALGVIFIPFFLVNSALTGAFTEEAVVIYNNDHISGIRIWTIPLEDFFYNTIMMASLFFFYFGWQKWVLKKDPLE